MNISAVTTAVMSNASRNLKKQTETLKNTVRALIINFLHYYSEAAFLSCFSFIVK